MTQGDSRRLPPWFGLVSGMGGASVRQHKGGAGGAGRLNGGVSGKTVGHCRPLLDLGRNQQAGLDIHPVAMGQFQFRVGGLYIDTGEPTPGFIACVGDGIRQLRQ